MLPSGLSEHINDAESLARFLTSDSQFNSKMVKPSAFLPAPASQETSVFRHGSEPSEALWAIGSEHVATSGRTVHGAAILTAGEVRAAGLAVVASEPPDRHAAIKDWPWIGNDPDLLKAERKERALLLAKNARLLVTPR